MATLAFADTLYLKDGSEIKDVKIVNQNNNQNVNVGAHVAGRFNMPLSEPRYPR
ncbi:MAG: hypothetical protein LBH25_05520 [Fibromonadaceae bacterium]|jgi:hypothetical protein|nr:hypothetical protein [Fibromonadaceae bacterium]